MEGRRYRPRRQCPACQPLLMVVPNRGRGEGKSVEDLGSRDLMYDKDKSAAPIPVWPLVEPLRSEQSVLCGLHDGWALGSVGKAHDPFDPQQVGATFARQTAEGSGEF